MTDTTADRLRARFDQLDADGSGYIEAKDFDLLAHRILQAFDTNETSPKGRAVIDSHHLYAQRLTEQLDANNDGRISFEEYRQGVESSSAFNRAVRPYAQAVVAIADRNDDGYVERDDFTTCLDALGFSHEGIAAAHSHLADPEGRVNATTWITFITDFYTADADHPAQVLVEG